MYIPARHGCLTVWLYLIIVMGVFALGMKGLAAQGALWPGYHPAAPWIEWSIVGCLLVSMSCAGGLLMLKRWGFYGYALANAALCGVNFAAGLDAPHALVPLLWVGLLGGVMRIGNYRERAWGRLR